MAREVSPIEGIAIGDVPSFLNFVDGQIHTQGLCLLKLSLYPSEGIAWSKLEACIAPSDIFHLLREASEGSEELALQKFLFALEAVGGTARGKHCAEEAKNWINESQHSGSLDFKTQTKKFRFFHSLVKIARKLPDEAGRQMKKHFSNHPKVQSNHRKFESIPELFIVLYQLKIISEDNSEDLQKELQRCKKYCKGDEERTRLDKCLSYLTNENNSDPFSDEESTDAESMLEPSVASVNTSQWKLKVLKYGFGILILCAIVAALAAVPCYFLVWSPLRDLKMPSTVKQLDGNTVILDDMNSFFVKEVTVKEHVHSRDLSHLIELYLVQHKCDDISRNITVEQYNGTEFQNTSSRYMLAGSKIDLHVCLSTDSDKSSHVHVDFYIVENVDKSDFDPYDVFTQTIRVGRGNTICTNITEEIHTSNYFFLIFLVPSVPLNISYELTLEIHSINLTALNTDHFGSITYDNESVSRDLAHFNDDYCLVADIYSYEFTHPFVRTEVTFTLNYSKTLGITLSVIAVWTIGWSVLTISLCCYFKRRRLHYKYISL